MPEITVTSSEFDRSKGFVKIPPISEDFEIPTVKTSVVVKNGIAAVPPTGLDFDVFQSIESDDNAWYNFQAAVEDVSRILNSLNECEYPTLDDRFRLNVALRRIRAGADKLEQHIAKSGLWLSEDEWIDCDSRAMWHCL